MKTKKMKMKLDDFVSSKLSLASMRPFIGGGCSCGSNNTNSTGADNDSTTGDSDDDKAESN